MKHTVEIDAIDIPTMYEMGIDEYRRHLETELFHVDHHDVLRSAIAGYPIAVTRDQLQALIAHLQSLEARVGAERGH